MWRNRRLSWETWIIPHAGVNPLPRRLPPSINISLAQMRLIFLVTLFSVLTGMKREREMETDRGRTSDGVWKKKKRRRGRRERGKKERERERERRSRCEPWAKQRSGEERKQPCSYSECVQSQAQAQAFFWYEAQAACQLVVVEIQPCWKHLASGLRGGVGGWGGPVAWTSSRGAAAASFSPD